MAEQRVRLAGIKEADIDSILSWSEDVEYLRMLTSDPAYAEPEVLQRARWQERLTAKGDYHFAVRTVPDDTLIGAIHIEDVEGAHGTAYIAIGIGDPAARGQGLGAEAMRLALDFAFDELNLHRVALTVFAFNERAIRLYEKLGFRREGTHREYLQWQGRRHDMHLYGLLAREWAARRGDAPAQ